MLKRTVENVPIKAAAVMRRDRALLIKALIAGKTRPRQNRFDEPTEVFEGRVGECLDLLIRHLEGDTVSGPLYSGQRIIELTRPEATSEENLSSCRASVEEDNEILRSFLSKHLSIAEMRAFQRSFECATAGMVTETKRHVPTLFIGDCLMVELASFLLGPLAAKGISIDPFPINPRDSAHLGRILDNISRTDYEAIFFSPFSHTRVPEINLLLHPKNAFMPKAELSSHITAVINQTQEILDFLSARFECPIFINNCSLVQRSRSTVKAAASLLMSHRVCEYARQQLNDWLGDYISQKNSKTFRHLFLIDENGIVQQHGRRRTGRYLHASQFQHPTVLSKLIAKEYEDRICALAQLMRKKLVICDLDNTLWDGVIGEGEVSHFSARQSTLKRLKEFGGIVLSIASKNDPAKIHFKGGILSIDDFVVPQISWDMKIDGIAKIQKAVNLQTRHMVFLDDRADERALVNDAFPDMLVMDASDDATWNLLNHWGELVHGSSDLDRTAMYQEQAKRDAAVGESFEAEVFARNEGLKRLELVITIRSAKKSDLKRVVELINRTNQWNLTGSRTSFEQMRAWQESEHAHVLIASAADKFGDMGTVCVAVVTKDTNRADIPIFVLSCRVFGYGVETAMLSEISRLCDIGGLRSTLVGHYQANNQNAPCEAMYSDHGFTKAGELFEWSGIPSLPEIAWAEVRAD
jgi:FkbH-like protein